MPVGPAQDNRSHGDPVSSLPCLGRASETTSGLCFDAALKRCQPRRCGDFALCLHRQEDDAKLGLARLELSKHVGSVAAPQADDAIAEARPILELV